jgi:hypothetical protein
MVNTYLRALAETIEIQEEIDALYPRAEERVVVISEGV